jgi:DNA polymerase I-like protein with 3'-5' exonuclease and polymerase domains
MMTDKIYLWEQPFFEGVDNEKLKWLFENIEMPIVEVTAKMEMRGVCIDGEFGEKLKVKYNNELTRIDEKINEELEHLRDKIEAWRLTPAANEKTKTYVPKKTKMTQDKIEEMYNLIDADGKRYKETKPKSEQLGDPINLASPVQLAILFYDVCGAPQVNSKNPRATGEDELKEMQELLEEESDSLGNDTVGEFATDVTVTAGSSTGLSEIGEQ